MSIGREDYQERKQKRIDALNAKASKSSIEANQEFAKAKKMGSIIPFGQPILIGHHSEGKHRRLIKKIDNAHRKAFEADERAAYYQDKAESAENNNLISGDDTEAVDRLKNKLNDFEIAKERMKAINKAWKQGGKLLYELGLHDEEIEKIKSSVTKIYPTWQISNMNAEIRRIKKRIEELTKLDQMQTESTKFSNGEMRINTEINRIQFIFDDIPSEETRKLLKSRGFKWSPKEKAWQRQRTINAINTTNRLLRDYFLK